MATFRAFLESTAPNEIVEIDDLSRGQNRHGNLVASLPREAETIDIYCLHEECETARHFDYLDYYPITDKYATLSEEERAWAPLRVPYRCRYCRSEKKMFALQVRLAENPDGPFEAVKLGEWPPFGDRLPRRVVTVLREDRDLLYKAKKALNAGLGIGAFGYYRRLVESQKVALFDEIIRTGRAIEVDGSVIASLKAARDERQFSRSMELGRDAIPDKLLFVGRNPFTLLHEALSEGLHAAGGEDHAEADKRCLELAGAIERVLVTLVEELDQLRRDREGLEEAFRTLDQRRQPPSSTPEEKTEREESQPD